MPDYTARADLVLEGGGVKGAAHVGALVALHRHGITHYPRIAGASAGAIVGACVAAGMTPDALHDVMRALDYRRFRDRGLVDRVPVVGKLLSLTFEEGVYEGDYLREFVGNVLADQGVTTFADLRIDDETDGGTLPAEQRYKLVVMATDVTRGRLVRLPWDYEPMFGLDPDEQLVADAVRASMSIPFYFEPVRVHTADGTPVTLVDGGVLSNFPIDVFDRRDGRPPRWPTFGIKLLPELPEGRIHLFPLLGRIPRGPIRLLEELVSTIIVGHDQTRLSLPWVAARTIRIDTSAVGVVDFGLDDAAADLLFCNGVDAAEAFLAGWDFDAYRERWRGGTPALEPAGNTSGG
jgi:NTE family protein